MPIGARINLTTNLPPGLRFDRAIALVWSAAPCWAAIATVGLLLLSTLPLAWLLMAKLVIDRLTGIGAENLTPQETFEGLAVLLVVAFLITIVTALAASLSGYANVALSHLVTDRVLELVQQKSIDLDFEYYENTQAYDKLHLAQSEAPHRPTQIVRELARLGQSFLALIVLLALLVTFHWAVVLVVLITSIPVLIYRIRYSRRLYDWRREMTLSERRAAYFNETVTTPQTAKELRLFGFGALMRARFTCASY